MEGFFIDQNGNYYEGMQISKSDNSVPKRPSDNYSFINSTWQIKQPTIQEQKDAISTAIQKMLDDKAKSLRYDSILSARSYAGYINPFQTEALKLADWAANCWATAGSIEAQVNAGTMTMPTVDQALAMMPVYQ